MEDVESAVKLKCNDKCNIDGREGKAAAVAQRAQASRKLTFAVVLCLVFMGIEIAGGIIANSLAILTDAAHLLSDIAGFAISLFAIWASGWEANPRQTFGYYRLEILGALLSIQLIWLVTGVLVYEAIVRFIHPNSHIDGRIMFIVACIGLGLNLTLMVVLGHEGHGHSHGHGHGHDHGEGHAHDHGHGDAHDHKHEEGHKHQHGHRHTHGHGKTKPTFFARVANPFRKKNHHHHGHGKEDTHDPGSHGHKPSTHDDEVHGHDDEVLEIHEHGDEAGPKESHGHDDDEVHETRAHDDKDKPEESHGHDDEIHSSDEDEGRAHAAEADKRKSVKVDTDLCPYEEEKSEKKGNINVRGAYLHVLGDMLQSIGVMLAGAVIWYKPSLFIIDPICTLFFSVLVLGTTYNMIREIVGVLMESTPREIDASALEKGLLGLTGVVAVHELHIWAITVGRSLLACHILAEPRADTNEVLHKVTDYCEKVYKISHVTIQVEREL